MRCEVTPDASRRTKVPENSIGGKFCSACVGCCCRDKEILLPLGKRLNNATRSTAAAAAVPAAANLIHLNTNVHGVPGPEPCDIVRCKATNLGQCGWNGWHGGKGIVKDKTFAVTHHILQLTWPSHLPCRLVSSSFMGPGLVMLGRRLN